MGYDKVLLLLSVRNIEHRHFFHLCAVGLGCKNRINKLRFALKALESSANMKYYLGNYYDKLKSVLTDRANNTDRYGIT